jgi:60 kDa SS-A/Ro ribonucleoprotein
MSKFNKVKGRAVQKQPVPRGTNTPKREAKSLVTTNLAGGVAYTMKEKTELVSILLTSFVADTFYTKGDDVTKRVGELVSKVADKKFIAKAAIYARNEFGMRSITHVVAGELAKSAAVKGETWTKSFYDQVVKRLDDMLEIVAFIRKDKKVPLPNALKKGFRQAFNRFDNYQLSKYQGNNGDIKLVDLVNLIHPIPTARNKDGLNALVNGKLKNLTTSQTALTNIGQKATTDAEAATLRKGYWTSVLTERRLGYTDLIRSLTKIAKDAPEAVDLAVQNLTTREAVQKSLVMPYQLYIAMKMVEKECGSTSEGRKLVKGLATAMEISCENVPNFGGKTLVVVDRSGSMDTPLSNGKADVCSMAEVGTLMALFLARKNDTDFMIFGDDAKYVPYNPQDSILTSVKTLLEYNKGYGHKSGYNVGHGTNFHSTFLAMNKKYDRIMFFSDMQGWAGGHYSLDGDLKWYTNKFGAKPFLYSHDLRGHGSLQLPEEKVFVSAGFNEKIFDIMKLLEQDKEALVHAIEKTVKL